MDLVRFYTDNGAKPLPYDPWTTHAIPTSDLEACAKAQGVTFLTGDILILRIGFTQRWYAATRAEREALHTREETLYVRMLCVLSQAMADTKDEVLELNSPKK